VLRFFYFLFFFLTLRRVKNLCLQAAGRVEERWRSRYSNYITGWRTEDSSFAFLQVQEGSPTQSVQTGCGVHLSSCSMRTGGSFFEGKTGGALG